MAVYGKMHGLNRDKNLQEGAELLKTVGLDDAAEKKVGKYSRGMQAKLGIAVAMIGNPELLILDEPTSGMDPAAASNIRKLLVDLKNNGTTVLLSSHLLHEVQNICQNISIINRRTVIAEGSVKEIIGSRYTATDYEAEFTELNDKLITGITSLDSVLDCKVVLDKRNSVSISVEGSVDIREGLARLAISNNSMLLSCNIREASLEDLFLSLVGQK